MELKAKNLSLFYGERQILKDLSFSLEEGEILTVLGANGVGKTSLVRGLLGFIDFKEGGVFINNEDAKTIKREDFRKLVSYLPQAKSPVFSYKGLEMVSLGLNPNLGFFDSPQKKDLDLVKKTMEDLDILKLADKDCRKMSGGEYQLILLARALVSNPAILVLDEPESSLDIKNQALIVKLIRELTKKRQLISIINTHFPQNAMRLADKVLILNKDLTYIFGDREIINEKNIKKAFDLDCLIGEVEKDGKGYSYLVTLE